MNQPMTNTEQALRKALEPLAAINCPEEFKDGEWVAKTLYCGNMVTAFSVRKARAALALPSEPSPDVAVKCGNCGYWVKREHCFCANCAEPAPWMPKPPLPSLDVQAAADALADRYCRECGIGKDGWCDVVIPNETWNEVFPNDGLYCFRCMTLRLIAAGKTNVPVLVASGPYQDANETWRMIGIEHGRLIERTLMWHQRRKLEPLEGRPESILLSREDDSIIVRMASKKGLLAHGDTIQEALRCFCAVLDLADEMDAEAARTPDTDSQPPLRERLQQAADGALSPAHPPSVGELIKGARATKAGGV